MLSAELLTEIRKHCQLLVGQIATSITKIPIKCYDVIVSSILPIVEHCRSKGVTAFYIPLAFAPRVKEGLDLPKSFRDRPIECSFVGSISSDIHRERLNLLDYLVKQVPIKFFGIGAENLPTDSLIRANYYGQAWGPELFRILGNSKITVNRHAEVKLEENSNRNVTDEFANNMRLFEATGMGALLITEYRDNLVDLFEVGKEIVVYRSADECAELIKYYLARPDQAEKIALAGQARTLKDHSYQNRMHTLSNYLNRLIYLKNETTKEIDYQKISYDYRNIDQKEISNSDVNAWKSPEIVGQQRNLVHQELTKIYQGDVVMPFRSLSTVLNRVMNSHDNILEIGCSSGYYYEVLSYLIPKRFSYTGVDYSEAMIELAKNLYPETPFYCASGDNLPLASTQFDLTISGCILLHCPNYIDHIKETVRVTKRCIVLSRTPISRKQPTRYFRKKAYGVETVELIFNEREIVETMAKHGFKLTHYLELDSDLANDSYTITYAFSRI
jgi:SAM-dependent methyltransferase